ASKRGTGSSVGPKILLAAVVVVAGVIGISGIYPQVIDAEWVRDASNAGTPLPIMSLSTAPTKRVPGTAAAVPSPQRRVVTTGQTAASPRSAPPEVPQTSTSPAAVEPPASATAIAVADIPDAEAKAGALPPDPAPPVAAKRAEKPKVAVVKKKVVVHHQ